MVHFYPYSDAHELNLDWILKKMKELDQSMTDFEAMNKITFSGEWDITEQYPAWTIVNNNGTGYISIQPVPKGINITNNNYWRSVIDYSETIADLQNRVVDLEEDVDDIKSDLRYAFDRIANVEKYVPETAKIILIGDSYLEATGAVTNYGAQLETLMPNATIYRYADAGSGFDHYGVLGKTFGMMASEAIADHSDEKIGYVFMIGGSNDRNQNQADVETYMASAIASLRAAWPTAKICVGFCGWTDMTQSSTDKTYFIKTCDTYKTCIDHDAVFVDGLQYVMHDYSNFYNAGHPNTDLQGRIAKFLYQFINNGYAVDEVKAASTYTYATGISKNSFSDDLQIFATRKGAQTIVKISGGFSNARNYGACTLNVSIGTNNEPIAIATLTGGLVFGVEYTSESSFATPITVVCVISGVETLVPASMLIINGTLYIMLSQGAVSDTSQISLIKFVQSEIVIDSEMA